jgi:hypothetical protein
VAAVCDMRPTPACVCTPYSRSQQLKFGIPHQKICQQHRTHLNYQFEQCTLLCTSLQDLAALNVVHNIACDCSRETYFRSAGFHVQICQVWNAYLAGSVPFPVPVVRSFYRFNAYCPDYGLGFERAAIDRLVTQCGLTLPAFRALRRMRFRIWNLVVFLRDHSYNELARYCADRPWLMAPRPLSRNEYDILCSKVPSAIELATEKGADLSAGDYQVYIDVEIEITP